MHPSGLYGIDPFRLIVLLVIIVGTWVMVHLARREGVSLQRLFVLQLAILAVALIGAKLFAWQLRGWEIGSMASELRSGWRYPGGLIAIVIATPLLQKWLVPGLTFRRYADLLALAMAVSMGVFRISCFLTGCCTGAQSQSWIAMTFARNSEVWNQQFVAGTVQRSDLVSEPVIPLQLLFMGASLLVAAILFRLNQHRRYDGQIVLWYLVLHEGAKGLLEFFRYPFVGELQTVSLIASAIGTIVLLAVYIRQKQQSAVQIAK